MGISRTRDLDLPVSMYKKHKSYYLVRKNKWIKLSSNKKDALIKYYELANIKTELVYMRDSISRYMNEVSPQKAERTYQTEIPAALNLARAFGHIPIIEMTPRMIYTYLDARSQAAPIRANREIALLSHIFTKSIRWGACDTNPCLGVERNKELPRKRYVTDSELKAFKATCPDWLCNYMDLKCCTALRQSDMLKLQWNDIKCEGIEVEVSKTKRKILIIITPHLKNVLERIRAQNPFTAGDDYIFSTKSRSKYTGDGFRSIFYRYMKKAVEIGALLETFQEKDLRAKAGTDASSLDRASRLLDHADAKVTRKHYRRKVEVVEPLF